MIYCEKCNKSFKNKAGYVNHTKSFKHTGASYRCKICLTSFVLSSLLNQHLKEEHIDTEIPSIEYYPNVISNDNCEVPSYSKTDTYIIDKNEILEHVESVDENKKISTHETVNYNKYILQPSPNSCQYELYVSVQGESPIQKNYWIDKRKHCPSLKLYQSPQSSNGLSIPVQPVSKKCYCASTKEERKRFSDICRLQNLINNKKTDFKQINRLILSVLVELEKDIIVDKIFFN